MKFVFLFNVLFSVQFYSFSLWAQSETEMPTIEISGKKAPLDFSPFPEVPQEDLPLSAGIIDEGEKEDARIQRLSDVTRLDASSSDSYNASGYWDFLSVRGFILDNRSSYFREGLPINAETSLPLDNKDSIEILKGLSGMQNGSGSPGGVVHLVVRRPPAAGHEQRLLSSVDDNGGFLLGADVGGRSHRHGYRAMMVYEDLNPPIDHSQGSRYLLGYAHDFSLSEKTLFQFEIENSRRAQKSQAALSLLGSALPHPNPRLNLNNQPWSTPVIFEALTSTLAVHYRFTESWQGNLTLGIQDLKTDDRLAYPFGCSAENVFDRFCSDGSFDVYDFRSDNERRRTEGAKIALQWTGTFGPLSHSLHIGALTSRSRDRFERQAYNYVGTGHIEGGNTLPGDPTLTDENTNRDSELVDLFAYDQMKFHAVGLWLGARLSHIERSSIRTDASRPTQFNEKFALPWIALSIDFAETLAYLSYGEGIETFVTPNRNTYSNPGEFLKDVRSHQYEIGWRDREQESWRAAIFEIHRPMVTDLAPAYRVDGKAVHRGLEAEVQAHLNRWTLSASTMWLQARREDSTLQSELNGRRPVNVPKSIWRASAEYQVNEKLRLLGLLSYEDDRAVTADEAVQLSSWTRWDLGASYHWRTSVHSLKLQAFIENALDAKFWKEAPTQYGHIYLYPAKERSLTLSLVQTF